MYKYQPKRMPVSSDMPESAAAQVKINIGAGLDIPTGTFIPGIHGEYNLNGGLGIVDGATGKANNYKSMFVEWKMIRAGSRMSSYGMEVDYSVYDTEENKDPERTIHLTGKHTEYAGRNLFEEGTYVVTGKSSLFGDKWFEKLKEFLSKKEANRKELLVPTPFLAADRKSLVQIMQPSFSLIDSFSEFETSDIADIMDEHVLGDSKGNTIYMRQSLAKNRLMMEYPRIGVANQHYLLTTAHWGKEIAMATGPYAPPPEKKMNSMKPGEMVKGVPPKYMYLVQWLGLLSGSSIMKTKDNTVEYPKDTGDKMVGDTDLWEVPILTLRSKFGKSSIQHSIIVSQSDGVQPSLTEFHTLRKTKFAMTGNDLNYQCVFLPEENLSRSVIRRKLDNNPALRRAINIASEMQQMTIYHAGLFHLYQDPKVVYEKIKEAGYDWNMILTKTRGWWKPNNDIHPLLPLSTYDIYRMALGKYHPYWLEDDKKTIKPQYLIEDEYPFT